MSGKLNRILMAGQKVTVEVPEIVCETATGILIEYNSQNAWFPKSKVVIQQKGDSVEVKIPRWLFERKF
ncbi:MAG TPA: hypothetical protein PKV71_06805 [Calditrichia bacterium]|nr:hypothetical protein [Calditrichota bacterium]HQU72636.1 hypothetical protein [Calditrichia bacterium]HQV31566.1 hypothetical protein [Calditrichia bacterium]